MTRIIITTGDILVPPGPPKLIGWELDGGRLEPPEGGLVEPPDGGSCSRRRWGASARLRSAGSRVVSRRRLVLIVGFLGLLVDISVFP
jgi:hypothetical protein